MEGKRKFLHEFLKWWFSKQEFLLRFFQVCLPNIFLSMDFFEAFCRTSGISSRNSTSNSPGDFFISFIRDYSRDSPWNQSTGFSRYSSKVSFKKRNGSLFTVSFRSSFRDFHTLLEISSRLLQEFPYGFFQKICFFFINSYAISCWSSYRGLYMYSMLWYSRELRCLLNSSRISPEVPPAVLLGIPTLNQLEILSRSLHKFPSILLLPLSIISSRNPSEYFSEGLSKSIQKDLDFLWNSLKDVFE